MRLVMKKVLSVFLVAITVLFSATSVKAFSINEDAISDWKDIYLTQQDFNDIVETKTVNERATGLIAVYSLGIKKDGNKLIIAGMTDCFTDVVKCGFKELVIQRREDSTKDWVDYVTYEDLYEDSFSYLLGKSITVGTGYQYRVTAVHYAKKNIFITQKVNNTSNTVVFA